MDDKTFAYKVAERTRALRATTLLSMFEAREIARKDVINEMIDNVNCDSLHDACQQIKAILRRLTT